MEISKERLLAAMLYKIAASDGKVAQEEHDAISRIATTSKDFDGDLLQKAFAEELQNPSDLRSLVDFVMPNDKAKLIYALSDIVMSDGIVCMDEIFILHEIADMIDISPAMVSYYLLKVMHDYPGVKFEDELND